MQSYLMVNQMKQQITSLKIQPLIRADMHNYGKQMEIISTSALEQESLGRMARRIFERLEIVRIFSKQPGKKADRNEPFVLPSGATVQDLAVKVHRELAEKLRYARAWGEVVTPIGRAFDPQLVLVSAGFDAHEDDPLGGMAVTGTGYAALADVCVSLAGPTPVVAVFEGGYSPDGIAEGSAAVVARLLDHPTPEVTASPDPRTGGLIAAYREAQSPFWPVLGP